MDKHSDSIRHSTTYLVLLVDSEAYEHETLVPEQENFAVLLTGVLTGVQIGWQSPQGRSHENPTV
jgi:hypothetical protein